MKNNNINDENKPLPIPASLFNDLNNNTILKIFNDCKCYQPNSDCDFPECERV